MPQPHRADEHARAEQAPPRTREPWWQHALHLGGFWLLYAALWFPLTTAGYLELYLVGAGAALIAAIAMEAVRAGGELRFRPRARWLLNARILPAAVLRDTALVFRATWRRMRGDDVTGAVRGAAFPPGGDDERATARRTIAEAAASVAPNTFCVGIDRDEGVMALHQLVRDDGPPDPADPLGVR